MIVITYGQILAGLGLLVLLIAANWLANYRSAVKYSPQAKQLEEAPLVQAEQVYYEPSYSVAAQPVVQPRPVAKAVDDLVSAQPDAREANFQREARLSDAAQVIGQRIAKSDRRAEYIARLNEEYAKLDWWSDRAHAIHTILIEANAAQFPYSPPEGG